MLGRWYFEDIDRIVVQFPELAKEPSQHPVCIHVYEKIRYSQNWNSVGICL